MNILHITSGGGGGGSSGSASDSKVETISRLVQWRIDSFGISTYRRSDAFKLGPWNWFLSVEKGLYINIRLFPEPCRLSKEQPPLAKFVLRVSNVGNGRRLYISPVHERLIRTSEDFVWPIDSTFHEKFIVDVEFLDLKMYYANGETCSIWPSEGAMMSLSKRSSLRRLGRMLEEGIHTDITIVTADGKLSAHKAVLAASSLVFRSMFLHDLKEKESSTVEIDDMSLEACTALLSYIYGCIKQEDFWKHRIALLGSANKYDIIDLKETCEESLLEDINYSNVLERLQVAWLYQLNKLKKGCLSYLFDFGKINDIKDDIRSFFHHADRDLMVEMFQELLAVWRHV